MNKETLNTLLMAVGIEIAVVLALVGIFLIFKMRKGKKADRNAAQALVQNVKGNEKSRRESLLQVFGESYDMDEDELNAAVDEFLKRERAFYKTLISVYVDRDAAKFAKLATDLEEMVKPYSDLALSADPAVDNEELEALQQQNSSLEKELNESKQVMDELLSEYTATFDKEGEGIAPEAVKPQSETEEESDEAISETEEGLNEQTDTELVSEENIELEGTMELTVDSMPESFEVTPDEAIDIEAPETEALETEALETDSADEVISDLVEEEQNANEIEAELDADQQTEGEEQQTDDSPINEVSLDEVDEDLEIA